MKALWWFKDKALAGMARPGFNAIHWSELPLDEGILLGWLGQYATETAPLSSFQHHIETYAPKIFPFLGISQEQGREAMRVFDSPKEFQKVASRLAKRTEAFADIEVGNEEVHIQVNEKRIQKEAEHLRSIGVRRIVSLTEKHHNKDLLEPYFDLHHLSINDLNAPTPDQAIALSEILTSAQQDGETVAVHCLAGIGRTSTMIVAAHMHLGEPLDKLKETLAQRNPTFILTGSQAAFIDEFRRRSASLSLT